MQLAVAMDSASVPSDPAGSIPAKLLRGPGLRATVRCSRDDRWLTGSTVRVAAGEEWLLVERIAIEGRSIGPLICLHPSPRAQAS
jgi:hypothetical protein